MRSPVRLGLLAAAAAALATAGCGYQLRGHAPSAAGGAIGAVQVTGSGYIVGDIETAVEGGGGRIVAAGDDADVVIKVVDDAYERRLLSVQASTGKSQEFQLAYRVTFDATRGDGARVVAPRSVRVLRDLVLDPEAVIGTIRDEEVIRVEMRRDAAERVVREVESALR